jgi:hypothetical protein
MDAAIIAYFAASERIQSCNKEALLAYLNAKSGSPVPDFLLPENAPEELALFAKSASPHKTKAAAAPSQITSKKSESSQPSPELTSIIESLFVASPGGFVHKPAFYAFVKRACDDLAVEFRKSDAKDELFKLFGGDAVSEERVTKYFVGVEKRVSNEAFVGVAFRSDVEGAPIVDTERGRTMNHNTKNVIKKEDAPAAATPPVATAPPVVVADAAPKTVVKAPEEPSRPGLLNPTQMQGARDCLYILEVGDDHDKYTDDALYNAYRQVHVQQLMARDAGISFEDAEMYFDNDSAHEEWVESYFIKQESFENKRRARLDKERKLEEAAVTIERLAQIKDPIATAEFEAAMANPTAFPGVNAPSLVHEDKLSKSQRASLEKRMTSIECSDLKAMKAIQEIERLEKLFKKQEDERKRVERAKRADEKKLKELQLKAQMTATAAELKGKIMEDAPYDIECRHSTAE